jgi:hypothetical protein
MPVKIKSAFFIFGFLWFQTHLLQAQNILTNNNRMQVMQISSSNYLFPNKDTLLKNKTSNPTTLKPTPQHSPKLAVLLSTALPGAGQIYNKKYWKAPIVWVGIGTCIYFISNNHTLYRDYKDALLQRTDSSTQEPDKYLDIYSTDQLLTLQDQYRQNRDLFIIVTSLVYVLNIVDALVDAHLYSFDVSDDLSFNWQPFYNYSVYNGNAAGISLRLNFK